MFEVFGHKIIWDFELFYMKLWLLDGHRLGLDGSGHACGRHRKATGHRRQSATLGHSGGGLNGREARRVSGGYGNAPVVTVGLKSGICTSYESVSVSKI